MSKSAPETQKTAAQSAAKTAPTSSTETVKRPVAEAPPVTSHAQPSATITEATLIVPSRPSTWAAAIGIALLIFLFGYVTGVAMSHSRMVHPMQGPGMRQQEIDNGQSWRNSRANNSSNIPSI